MAPSSLDMTWAGIGVGTSILPHFTRFNKGAHGHPRIFVRAAEAAAAGGGGGGRLDVAAAHVVYDELVVHDDHKNHAEDAVSKAPFINLEMKEMGCSPYRASDHKNHAQDAGECAQSVHAAHLGPRRPHSWIGGECAQSVHAATTVNIPKFEFKPLVRNFEFKLSLVYVRKQRA